MGITKHLGILATVLALTGSAHAEVGAELSFWGMGVFTSNGTHDGTSSCSAGVNAFCDDVFGYGGAASVYFPLGKGISFSADILHESHADTNDGPSAGNGQAQYSSLGLHLTRDANPNMPWGGFIFTAIGESNTENDTFGPVFGFGGEIMLAGFQVQTGRIGLLENRDVSDNMDHFYYVGVAREFDIWNGALTAGAIYGQGDFDAGPDDDQGKWVNISLTYEAPLGQSKMNWFVGYEADYMRVDQEFAGTDKAIFHALKAGITIPLGAGKGPFQTPNFRAPLVNADAMN